VKGEEATPDLRPATLPLFALPDENPMTPDAVSRTRPNAPNFENFWIPFTANRQFKESPRLLVSAEGMNYTSIDDKTILKQAPATNVKANDPRSRRR
jgi:hypothetical protein